MNIKKCSGCKIFLRTSEFGTYRRSSDGLYTHCQKCQRFTRNLSYHRRKGSKQPFKAISSPTLRHQNEYILLKSELTKFAINPIHKDINPIHYNLEIDKEVYRIREYHEEILYRIFEFTKAKDVALFLSKREQRIEVENEIS